MKRSGMQPPRSHGAARARIMRLLSEPAEIPTNGNHGRGFQSSLILGVKHSSAGALATALAFRLAISTAEPRGYFGKPRDGHEEEGQQIDSAMVHTGCCGWVGSCRTGCCLASASCPLRP
jgi:hypothetical protein